MNIIELLNTSKFRPLHLEFPDSWIGHFPFANWLIRTIRPSILVELGTHTGNSYFSFCQSVKESNLLTKCYAVDTWKGDKHAGFYEEEVFIKVNQINAENYGKFSRLMRMTFDQALNYFSNESIDLLHIDGMHSYEAVKHDFESWLPKMKPNAVVLLHDTNVREKGFGVWKLWEELKQTYPQNIAFSHSNGLGIIQLSDGSDHYKLDFFNEGLDFRKVFIEYFTSLGKNISDQYKIRVDSLKVADQINDIGSQRKKPQNLVGQYTLQISDLQSQLSERDQKVKILQSQLNKLTEELRQQKQLTQNLNSTLLEIYSSTAWKIIRIIWKIRLFLFPHGSIREKLGKKSQQVLSPNKHSKVVPIKIRKITPKELIPLYSQDVENPKVSIIIPVYNQKEITINCLYSLKLIKHSIPYEVIIIDDASIIDEYKFLDNLNGVKYIRNEENIGYLISCKEGAKYAAGDILVFLNNDTSVLDGWLDELVWPFENLSDVGLVGAKLLYPNGRLQEAGGIIWQDGNGMNFGNNDDPEKPIYNFLRSTDYCSGACIALTKNTWEKIGGYDELFAPAYYEDTDLAFQIRKLGLKTVYQPFSRIIHFEGSTSGTDITKGVKKYQKINHEKFLIKWLEVLATHGKFDDFGKLEFLNRDKKYRALFIDATTPTPDRDSGSIDAFNYMKILSELGFFVSFIPDNLIYFDDYSKNLQLNGIQVIYSPYIQSIEEFLKINHNSFDLIIISRYPIAKKYIPFLRYLKTNTKIIFNTVDLHFLRTEREAELKLDPKLQKLSSHMKIEELDLMKFSDYTLVVSNAEENLINQINPEIQISTISIPREIPGRINGFADRKDIVFIGGFHHQPNIDAVNYFLNEIWPLINDRKPEIRFLIVGSNIPDSFFDFENKFNNVVVKGFVQDLSEVFSTCKLSIAPLRFGAGVKGKIVTSLSYGVPCVATPLAIEGMGLVENIDIQIATSPEEFLDKVLELYSIPTKWEYFSENGLKFTIMNFSIEKIKGEFMKLLFELGFDTYEKNQVS